MVVIECVLVVTVKIDNIRIREDWGERIVDNVNWEEVTRQVIYDVLGDPVHETSYKLYWPGRDTGRGDDSRSFTYTLLGNYAGNWYDWSVGVGGKSVFKFLEFWHGWDKPRSVEYLKERCFLSDDEFVYAREWKQWYRLKKKVGEEVQNQMYVFGDRITRDVEEFQKVFNDAWVNSVKYGQDKRRFELVSKAWSEVRDEMLEALLLLAERVDDEKVYVALQTLCAARANCMKVLSSYDCFPEVTEDMLTEDMLEGSPTHISPPYV